MSEIVTKLLVPRSVTHFAELQKVNMEQDNMLFVASDDCSAYARDQPEVMTELNQILISKNTQVKKVSLKDVDTTNIGDYEYVLSCGLSEEKAQKYLSRFGESRTFAGGVFQLYKNPSPRSQFYVAHQVYALDDGAKYVNSKAAFVEDVFGEQLNFVNEKEYHKQTTSLNDIFESITPRSIASGKISANVTVNTDGQQELIVREQKEQLFYRIEDGGSRVTFSPSPLANFTPLLTHDEYGHIDIQSRQGKPIKFEYIDKQYGYTNMLQNPSFENGPWHKDVSDCNDYDNSPELSMKVDPQEATDGQRSLQLHAQYHTACTNLPQKTALEPGATYLLSFDYRSTGPRQAGYYISFGKAAPSVSETFTEKGGVWHTLNTVFTAPEAGAHSDVTIYAFPDELAGRPATVNYDNFTLTKIPALQGAFHMIGHPPVLKSPRDIRFEIINPTQKNVQVKNATTPFFLGMNDSYHPRWRLSLRDENAGLFSFLPWASTASIGEENHFRLNNVMNGWYIDPEKLCSAVQYGCTRNADGSYDIQLVADFTPQHWFEAGLFVSAVTLIGCVLYLIYDNRKHRASSTRGKGNR